MEWKPDFIDTLLRRIGSENGDYSQLLALTQIGKNAFKAKQQNIIINFHLLHFVQCTSIVQHFPYYLGHKQCIGKYINLMRHHPESISSSIH